MKVRIIFEKGMLFSSFSKNVPETSIILSKLLKTSVFASVNVLGIKNYFL